MRKTITWLYNKFCEPNIKSLYLSGIQRDFTHIRNPQEERQLRTACIEFVNSKAIDYIFNEILKEYSESLFSLGETEEVRNFLHNNINVVLKVEKKIKDYAHLDEAIQIEDPFKPL